MAESLLQLIEHVLGDQIAPFARLLHAVVLAVTGIVLVYPLLISYIRERQKTRGTYWVPMWHCRSCGHFNPPDFVECQKCRNPMETSWWEKVLPSFFVETVGHGAQFLMRSYGLAGWVLFYGATLFAFVNLRLYSFTQYPLQELMASMVMVLLLLTLHFFGRAFHRGLASPAARLTDAAAGAVLAGFVVGAGFLWTCSPFPPGKPLAYLHPAGESKVRLLNPGGLQTLAPALGTDGGVKINVQYAEVRWPLFYLNQAFVTRLAGEPVLDPGTLLLFDAGTRVFTRDDPYRLRVVMQEQSFMMNRGKDYLLRRARDGAGLVLEERI
jgi:hypothetical protein